MKTIDGEVLDSRALPTTPHEQRPTTLTCATHPAWLDCHLQQPGCVQHFLDEPPPDGRAWTEKLTTWTITDRRRT